MATQIQAAVSGALQRIGLEFQPDPSGVVGGEQTLKITAATVEKIKNDKGTTVVVDSQGQLAMS